MVKTQIHVKKKKSTFHFYRTGRYVKGTNIVNSPYIFWYLNVKNFLTLYIKIQFIFYFITFAFFIKFQTLYILVEYSEFEIRIRLFFNFPSTYF